MALSTPADATPATEVETLPISEVAEQAPIEQAPIETPVVTETTKHEDLLKGVDDVLKKVSEAPAVTTPEKPADAPEAAPDAAKGTPDPKAVVTTPEKPAEIDPALLTEAEKEDDKLAFKDHPRFVALRQEALQSRATAKAFETQLQPLRQSAEKLTAISGFVNGNGISEDEFVEGLQIMAALKTNPLEAARLLAPHLAQLQKFTGEGELPKELEDRVQAGELSEAGAREIVRSRVEAQIAQARVQRVQQEQQHVHVQQNISSAGNAVSAWEANISKTDPDYAKKQPLVLRLIQSEAKHSQPKTPTEAVALAQRCYADVNKHFAVQAPKPATKPTPSTASVSQARTVVLPKPKSLLDGVGQALAGVSGR